MRLALHIGIVAAGLVLALPVHAQGLMTDAQIRAALIRQSIAAYPGPCPCPYNIMRNGKPCGTSSAYSKPGGRAPLCYERDVTAAMVREARRGGK